MSTLSDERRGELDAALATVTIPDIQKLFDAGSLTAEELVIYYLDRIKRYDVDNFNSVLALNPQALEEAKAMDAERANGQSRGMMHGIPILLKDNIAIEGMNTAAGAHAMKDWTPDRDATVTTALRTSGAVILGKANLSEWANWMDAGMPNGFSALGGQTRNPYGSFETWGSSSGSAVAAAANFAVVTVGSETEGSLLMPAYINSAVGLKPTHPLVSGDYIIPLMPFQDNAGPMGRSVTDVAVLLTAMVSPDPNDADAMAKAGEDYTSYFTTEALSGLRLGMTGASEGLQAELERLGIQVVVIDSKDIPSDTGAAEILPPVFKYAINDFLPAVNAPVKSLDEVIAINKEDMKNRAPYGQGHLEASQNTELSKEETEKKIEERIKTYSDTLTALFDQYNVDVIMVNDIGVAAPLGQTYAPAGWPAMAIPAGYRENGEPISISFVARPYEDGKMLAAAYVIEQIAKAYRPPNLETTIQMLDEKLGDQK
ncbi:MAG: amidase [Chloroflexi bacterium]|nr:amidase [Chloroflexota bacterium]